MLVCGEFEGDELSKMGTPFPRDQVWRIGMRQVGRDIKWLTAGFRLPSARIFRRRLMPAIRRSRWTPTVCSTTISRSQIHEAFAHKVGTWERMKTGGVRGVPRNGRSHCVHRGISRDEPRDHDQDHHRLAKQWQWYRRSWVSWASFGRDCTGPRSVWERRERCGLVDPFRNKWPGQTAKHERLQRRHPPRNVVTNIGCCDSLHEGLNRTKNDSHEESSHTNGPGLCNSLFWASSRRCPNRWIGCLVPPGWRWNGWDRTW